LPSPIEGQVSLLSFRLPRDCQNQDFQDWRDFQDFTFAQSHFRHNWKSSQDEYE